MRQVSVAPEGDLGDGVGPVPACPHARVGFDYRGAAARFGNNQDARVGDKLVAAAGRDEKHMDRFPEPRAGRKMNIRPILQKPGVESDETVPVGGCQLSEMALGYLRP